MFGFVFLPSNFIVEFQEKVPLMQITPGNSYLSLNRVASVYFISLYRTIRCPRPPNIIFPPRFRILKLFEPMLEKLSVILPFSASIEVRIPTIAIIPNEIISAVSTALSLLPFIDPMATFIFSLRFSWFSISAPQEVLNI